MRMTLIRIVARSRGHFVAFVSCIWCSRNSVFSPCEAPGKFGFDPFPRLPSTATMVISNAHAAGAILPHARERATKERITPTTSASTNRPKNTTVTSAPKSFGPPIKCPPETIE